MQHRVGVGRGVVVRFKGGVCCALQYGRGGGSVRQFESGWPSVCARARALSVWVRLVVGGGDDMGGEG